MVWGLLLVMEKTYLAPTASGYGYLMLAADGGVFAFGDAHFDGAVVDGHHLATAIAILFVPLFFRLITRTK